MTNTELAKRILHSFIDGLSPARDKRDQLKKLIDDFEIALKEEKQEENEEKPEE